MARRHRVARGRRNPGSGINVIRTPPNDGGGGIKGGRATHMGNTLVQLHRLHFVREICTIILAIMQV